MKQSSGKKGHHTASASMQGPIINNFQISQITNNKQGENHFVSLNRQAMESIKENKDTYRSSGGVKQPGSHRGNATTIENKTVPGDPAAQKGESHFNLGNEKTLYKSQASHTMVEHSITTKNVHDIETNRRQQRNNMRKANFKIPYQRCMDTEETTYKNQHSDMVEIDKLNPGKQALRQDLKQSSINIADKTKQLECITETAQQFIRPTLVNPNSTRNQ